MNPGLVRVLTWPGVRIALLLLVPIAGLWYTESRRSPAMLPIGNQLPQIRLETIAGPRIDPTRTSRPTAVLVFTASCQYCLDQLLRWDSLQEELNGRVDLLAVSFSDRRMTEAAVSTLRHSLSIAQCGDARSWIDWRVTRVPTVFLLDARGVLVTQWSGLKPIDEERKILSQLASFGPARE